MIEDLQKNVILSEAKNPAKVRSTFKKRIPDALPYPLGLKRAENFHSYIQEIRKQIPVARFTPCVDAWLSSMRLIRSKIKYSAIGSFFASQRS